MDYAGSDLHVARRGCTQSTCLWTFILVQRKDLISEWWSFHIWLRFECDWYVSSLWGLETLVVAISPITDLIRLLVKSSHWRCCDRSVGPVLSESLPNSFKPMGQMGTRNLASTMNGSTETTFYVLAVYFGSVGVHRYRDKLSGLEHGWFRWSWRVFWLLICCWEAHRVRMCVLVLWLRISTKQHNAGSCRLNDNLSQGMKSHHGSWNTKTLIFDVSSNQVRRVMYPLRDDGIIRNQPSLFFPIQPRYQRDNGIAPNSIHPYRSKISVPQRARMLIE